MVVRLPPADTTFALTADVGLLGEQAHRLCASLNRVYEDPSITVFIPADSYPEMATERTTYLESVADVVTGDIPIPDYPVSALPQAFCHAADHSDTTYLVALDTDATLIRPLTLPAAGADFYALPAPLGAQYWGSEASHEDWQSLYNTYDLPMPTNRVTTGVDQREILPYYNSGVVVTTDYSLPRQWLDITEHVYTTTAQSAAPSFFSDQVALAITAEMRDVVELTPTQNYLLGMHFGDPPNDVELLHYGTPEQLARLRTPDLRERLHADGWDISSLPLRDRVACYLPALSANAGRYLSYSRRRQIRALYSAVRDGVL